MDVPDAAGPETGHQTALGRAVHAILRPLVRLLLERQVTFPYLVNLLKSVYVEVAVAEFTIEGRPQTDSRISLLTGIHRKNVKRLREELETDAPMPFAASLGALLVSRWIADPALLDDGGRPLALPRLGTGGEVPSFEELVASVSKDIPARSVLDEWLRLGVAKLDADDRVELCADSFVPERGLEEKIHFFGRNLHDHVAAGVHNLLAEGPPLFDRSVYYDGLGPDAVAQLAELAREEGSALLRRLNLRALALQSRNADDPTATHRMTIGAYFYTVDAEQEPEATEDE